MGVKAGATYSRLQFELNDTDRQAGIVAGVMARIPFSSGFFLQPELLYVQKGGRTEDSFRFLVDGEEQIVTVEQTHDLSYLEVPLTAQLRLPIESVQPTLFAGPYASFEVGSSYSVTPEQVGDRQLETEVDYEGVGYGAVLGASLDLPVGTRTVVLDVRYDFGLRDLNPGMIPSVTGDVNRTTRNDSFLLTVGLLF